MEEPFDIAATGDDLDKVRASEAGIDYLITAVNAPISATPARADVCAHSRTRPPCDDGAGQDAARDHVLTLRGDAPARRNMFGGEITTNRYLSEGARQKLAAALPEVSRNASRTARAALPGGDFAVGAAEALAGDLTRQCPFLSTREARRFGTEARRLLQGPLSRYDLGRAFEGDLMEAEVTFPMRNEFARTGENVVWRRMNSGLRMCADEIAALAEWIARRSDQTNRATA